MVQDTVSKAGKVALIAAVMSTSMSFAPPDVHLLQPAQADEEVCIQHHVSCAAVAPCMG